MQGVFTRLLEKEHRLIERALGSLVLLHRRLEAGAVPEGELGQALERVTALKLLIGDVHHGKEERILLPALAASPEGGCARYVGQGEHCTLYMEHRIQWDLPGELVSRAVAVDADARLLRSEVGRSPHPEGSLLLLPIEEHEAGSLALRTLERGIREGSDAVALSSLLASYLRHMRWHIEKEDRCLFGIADRVLSDAEQARLLEASFQLEAEIGRERIAAAMETLACA